MALSSSIREKTPEVTPECIHCYGSGWILDSTEDDEGRTFPCHMCREDAARLLKRLDGGEEV
jgi:hypothetical protein